MFVPKNNSHFAVFPGFEEGKEGEREMGGQVRHQVWLSGVVSFNCRLEVVGEVGEVYFLTLNILCINANNNYLG